MTSPIIVIEPEDEDQPQSSPGGGEGRGGGEDEGLGRTWEPSKAADLLMIPEDPGMPPRPKSPESPRSFSRSGSSLFQRNPSFRRMSSISQGVRRGMKRTLSTLSGDSGVQRRGSYIWPDGTVDETSNLKPKITLLNAITIIVGSVIGSGIFVSPKGVLEYTGSIGLSLIIWTLCGLYSMIGCHCFNELGTMIKKSGADYIYIKEAFGPFLGFLRIWVECVVVKPGINAIIAITFGIYIIKPLYPDCPTNDAAVSLLAAVAISRYHHCFHSFFCCLP